jgi:hypothetical protein
MSEAQSDMPVPQQLTARSMSSSEQMARNDEGDKLQALEALQCDSKWLSRGHARAGGFSLMLGRAHAAALRRSGTGLLASSCEIATTSLDLSRYSSPQLAKHPSAPGLLLQLRANARPGH